MKRRPVIIILIAMLTFSAWPLSAAAGTSAAADSGTAETTVSGIAYTNGTSASKTLKDTVYVSPAASRTICLRLYNSSTGQYTDQASFTSDSTGKAVISYPSARSKKTYSKWQLYIPAADGYSAYTSSTISIVTRNIKNVSLASKTGCVYCVDTGRVIYGKYMNTKRKQASTTKLMTALLIMQQTSLSSKARVSKKAAYTSWRNLYMKTGDSYYVKDLMYALLLPSSNDAANVLAEKNAGSQKAFVKKMNAKAKALGLTRTSYKNAHGLDTAGHYTTAYDLARLTACDYRYSVFRKIIKTKKHSFRSLRYKVRKSVSTTDRLLGYTSAFNGGKTGFDDSSKYCFSGVYVYKGKTYIASTLGSPTSSGRWNDSKKLWKYIKQYGGTSW